MDVAYWKRRYQALHEETNTLKKASKRKGEWVQLRIFSLVFTYKRELAEGLLP
jgi:hypothetical protein